MSVHPSAMLSSSFAALILLVVVLVRVLRLAARFLSAWHAALVSLEPFKPRQVVYAWSASFSPQLARQALLSLSLCAQLLRAHGLGVCAQLETATRRESSLSSTSGQLPPRHSGSLTHAPSHTFSQRRRLASPRLVLDLQMTCPWPLPPPRLPPPWLHSTRSLTRE